MFEKIRSTPFKKWVEYLADVNSPRHQERQVQCSVLSLEQIRQDKPYLLATAPLMVLTTTHPLESLEFDDVHDGIVVFVTITRRALSSVSNLLAHLAITH